MDNSSIYNFLINKYGDLSSFLPFGYALPPIRATIEITYKCNLCCKMCYQQSERNKKIKEMDKDDIKKVIDQMLPKTLISLTGGEMFTRNYIFEIINYATKRHVCNIVTNATLINKEIAKKIVRSGIVLIGVSIDGIEPTHNSIRGIKNAYEKSIKGIELIQKEKERQNKKFPQIDIKTVILPDNTKELYEIYKLAEKVSADYLTISVLKGSDIQLSPPVLDHISPSLFRKNNKICKLNVNLLKQQINKIVDSQGTVKLRFYPGNLSKQLESYFKGRINNKDYYSCTYPWVAFNVSPHGDVFPCISLKVGNIKEQKLDKIWNGKKMRSFRLQLRKHRVFSACQGCCNLWFK